MSSLILPVAPIATVRPAVTVCPDDEVTAESFAD
jgi:hypothetical protein